MSLLSSYFLELSMKEKEIQSQINEKTLLASWLIVKKNTFPLYRSRDFIWKNIYEGRVLCGQLIFLF